MSDVIVLGAGISGLTSAVRLLTRGARVTVVAAGEPTVSRLAAAVWYPTHTVADPRVLTWATATYDELMQHAADGIPGCAFRPTRMLLRSPDSRPWWAPAVPSFTALWEFTVPSTEMEVYLQWLIERVQALGGTVERRRVTALTDLAGRAPILVNASGLAARELAADPSVFPARGQIVVVANPGLVTSIRDEDHPDGMTYIHPRRHDVVLGGTFQPDDWSTAVDPATTAAILRRCTALVPELASAEVLWQAAGLRPARHGGPRVELDPVPLPDGTRVIHNYGHGGAGVTLSWGCATEVAALALALG